MTEDNKNITLTAQIDHIDRSLSMIIHHEEIQQMVDIVKEVLKERHNSEAKDAGRENE